MARSRAVPLPAFTDAGDLPPGIHRATLTEAVAHFGAGPLARKLVAGRLERVHAVAAATTHLARFIVFGSFLRAKAIPHDLDVFMLMDDEFDAGRLDGEARVLFHRPQAQSYFGVSALWLRRCAAFPDEQAAVADWQVKRDGSRRGLVEVVPEWP
jgi:hypothetical protein